MDKCCKVHHRLFIAHDQAAKILQPRVRALNNPPTPIPTQLAAILMRSDSILAPLGNERLDRLFDQHGPDSIAVVAPIGNQSLRFDRAALGAAAAREAKAVMFQISSESFSYCTSEFYAVHL